MSKSDDGAHVIDPLSEVLRGVILDASRKLKTPTDWKKVGRQIAQKSCMWLAAALIFVDLGLVAVVIGEIAENGHIRLQPEGPSIIAALVLLNVALAGLAYFTRAYKPLPNTQEPRSETPR
jgi:hypothetical protein